MDTSSSGPETLAVHMMPSPISESPLKETVAIVSALSVGHSALSQELPRSSSPEPLDDVATSPVEYVPPPVVDSFIGNPGAFKDQDEEELPQPIVVSDPHRLASKQDDPYSHAPSFPEPPVPTPAPHNIISEHEEDLAMPEPESTSAHKSRQVVDATSYPSTSDNPAGEAAPYSNDVSAHEDNSHPMERRADMTSILPTDSIAPPIPVDIVDVLTPPRPISPTRQDPLSASYHTVPVDDLNSRTNILASSPCSESRSVHLDNASLL